MSTLNLDQIKAAYSNDYSKEGELIKELASALGYANKEINEINVRFANASKAVDTMKEELKRERGITDALLRIMEGDM